MELERAGNKHSTKCLEQPGYLSIRLGFRVYRHPYRHQPEYPYCLGYTRYRITYHLSGLISYVRVPVNIEHNNTVTCTSGPKQAWQALVPGNSRRNGSMGAHQRRPYNPKLQVAHAGVHFCCRELPSATLMLFLHVTDGGLPKSCHAGTPGTIGTWKARAAGSS